MSRSRNAARFHVLAAGLLLVLGAGCGGNDLKPPTLSGSPSQNAGNFATTVFVGDSLTAGFQNGSLLDVQQPNGYANLIAQQAGFKLELPLIAPPGAPAVLELVSPGPPPVIQQVSGITTGRDDITTQPTDLAVPGHTVNDVLNTKPLLVPLTAEDTITYLVLGFPGIDQGVQYTQLQWAHQLNPTTLFLWIGSNDALVADETGTPASMTPVTQFTSQFTQLIQQLQSQTRANLVIATVPDVTAVAYLTPGALVLGEYSAATGIPVAQLSAALGIQAADLVNPTGLTEIGDILSGKQTGPVDDAGFLSVTEQATVRQTIDQYNAVITQQAAAAGATLIDLHSTLLALEGNPPVIAGVPISFGFGGGFFSLDGIHPTNTGYALIANAFIDTMNARLGTKIADVDVDSIAARDPLYPHPGAQPTVAKHITPQAAQALKWMLHR